MFYQFSKFMSRKFIAIHEAIALNIGVPILFHKTGLSDTVILAVMASISTLTFSYLLANVREAKNAKDPQ